MDEFLPSEILAKIASNLSYKDVNSLLRTSKTAHAKLAPYRHILPKMKCNVIVQGTPDKIWLQVIFSHKDMEANFYDRIENEADELTEEEKRNRVVQFYKGSVDTTVKERTFRGRLEGLSLHIQTIQAFATIGLVVLHYVDDDLILEELARLIRQSRSRIDSVEIYSKGFRSSNLEFITACKPLWLTVHGEVHLPDSFYNLPAIQRLERLEDYYCEKRVNNLSFLSASDINIYGRHNVRIDDVEQIIIQWAESKRRIESIVISDNNLLNKQKCMEWIGNLDSSLFEVKPGIHDVWILTRCCDCSKIQFECSRKLLIIRSAV